MLQPGRPAFLPIANSHVPQQPTANSNSPMPPLLRLEAVTKRFGGTVAVDRLTAALDPGQVYGLIGPNGSGKTTLINLISGLYEVDAGAIVLDPVAGPGNPSSTSAGQAPSAGSESAPPTGSRQALSPPKGQTFHLERRLAHEMAALGIVRTFQMPKAFGTMTLVENLLVPVAADHRRESLAALHARAHEVLDHTGLAHLAEAPAGALSGGQTMLLQLARALMHEPMRLLLLDEPFAGVAPAIKERMMATIRRINDDRGATVLLVSHEMTTVRQLCRRVLVMNTGRLIAEGTLAEVASRPEVIEAYLGKPM
jgi:branched-chain amino acid transport system ATP-binding protein